MGIVFCDTETTGLDPDRHEIWEIALIPQNGSAVQMLLVPDHLETADPSSLRMNHFYERWANLSRDEKSSTYPHRSGPSLDHYYAAQRIARITAGHHIVGAVPSFDDAFMSRFLRAHGQTPAWHYHLIDVETLIAGRFALEPPLDSESLSRMVSVDPERFERHTALGDALWVRAQYEAVMGR